MHEASEIASELLFNFGNEAGSVEICARNIDVTTLPIDGDDGPYHCIAGYLEKF